MQVCGNIDSDSGVYRTITPAEDSDTFDQRFALFEQSHDSWLLSFTSALQTEARQAIDERNNGGNHDKFDKLCAIYSATLKEVQDGLMGPAWSEAQLRSKFAKDGLLTCRVQRRFAIYQGTTPRTCQKCFLTNTPCPECHLWPFHVKAKKL